LEAVSSRYWRLRLRSPEIAARALPGQFVMISCSPDESSLDPLLPRPLAILDAADDWFELLYFCAGRGTALLHRQAERALLLPVASRPSFRLLGPAGKPFVPLDNVDAHVGVGGGSGVAPLVCFFRRQASPQNWHLILGARSAEQLVRPDSVTVPAKSIRATDDGSEGFRGNAAKALEALLDGELRGKRVAVYAAGPEPMMHAAAKIAAARGQPCVVSLEARMACGIGVCRACIVDGVTPHPKSGLKRRAVCLDGPVFLTTELAGWA